MKITKKAIKELKTTERGTLKNYVINSILREENSAQYIEDVLKHGCQSGIVIELVYYNQTNRFFDKFSAEILEIMEESRKITGDFMISFNKNTLAWLGYEETLRNIAYELDMDI